MRREISFVLAAMVLCVAAPGVLADDLPWVISCEGTQSTGGGVRRYQYEIKNNTSASRTLGHWWVASDDPNANDYTNWLLPSGWTGEVQSGGLIPTVTETDRVKTPHGGLAPLSPHYGTVAQVVFNRSQGMEVAPGQSLRFGFDNPFPSEDVNYVIGMLEAWCIWAQPVAGPLGTFTNGPVHGPVPEPASLAMLILGGLLLLRRSR